jgi:hypothetical protein
MRREIFCVVILESALWAKEHHYKARVHNLLSTLYSPLNFLTSWRRRLLSC